MYELNFGMEKNNLKHNNLIPMQDRTRLEKMLDLHAEKYHN